MIIIKVAEWSTRTKLDWRIYQLKIMRTHEERIILNNRFVVIADSELHLKMYTVRQFKWMVDSRKFTTPNIFWVAACCAYYLPFIAHARTNTELMTTSALLFTSLYGKKARLHSLILTLRLNDCDVHFYRTSLSASTYLILW